MKVLRTVTLDTVRLYTPPVLPLAVAGGGFSISSTSNADYDLQPDYSE